MEYYSALKNNKMFTVCNKIDPAKTIMLSEISYSPEEKYYMISIRQLIYSTPTHIHTNYKLYKGDKHTGK